MPLPINVFNGSREAVSYIWERLKPQLSMLPSDFPQDETSLVYWLLAPNSMCFIVGEPTAPAGLMLINEIQPNDNAYAHVLMWERKAVPYIDLVNSARAVAVNVMQMFNLYRLTGLTPGPLGPALAFLVHVGFKREGRMRSAVNFNGHRYDLIISGLTRDDLAEATKDPSALMPLSDATAGIMEEKESRAHEFEPEPQPEAVAS